MKKHILSAAIVAACGFAVITSASASTGTITFTGEVNNQTCSAHGDGGTGAGADFNIGLSAIQASSLVNAGAVGTTTSYAIIVDGGAGGSCPDGTKVHITYEPNNSITPEGYLKNTDSGTGAATKVALQLLNNGTPMNLVTDTASDVKEVAGGAARFPFAVQYISLGGATGGTVSSAIQYSIAYD